MITACLMLAGLVASADTEIPIGPGRDTWNVGNRSFEIFTYRPDQYIEGPVLIVFHGTLRNANEYRDFAVQYANDNNTLVIAPKFDADRFPNEKYHRGGLLMGSQAVPPSERTFALVPQLIAETRRRLGRKDAPVALFGHSAGGQFLTRLAAFQKVDVERIVASNPGTDLFVDRTMKYPLGFGGLPSELQSDEQLKQYLAAPLTLYLGTGDKIADPDLSVDAESMKQGANRYERGQNAFAAGEALAKKNGWKFNWKLIDARGVGHDAKGMLDAPNARLAIRNLPPPT